MSFTSSARTVRDRSRPTGHRVRAFHQCIESFAPFGYEPTRRLLRRVLDVTSGAWTDEQLLHGIDLLEQARRSWVAARDGADVRTHRPASRYNLPPLEGGVPFGQWLVAWAHEDGIAERWRTAEVGTCTDCAHLLVLHRQSRGCWACAIDPAVGWERCCRVPSPLETEGAAPPSASSWSWWWSCRLRRGRRARRSPGRL